jgi:S1-C subfamily serine protease
VCYNLLYFQNNQQLLTGDDKMKKVTSLILMFTLIFASLQLAPNSQAAFVTQETATQTLHQLGLIIGDENGDFGLETTLTREIGVVMLCRLLGLEDYGETSPFDDVADWAQGYINRAYTQGLVSGVGNGKFDANGELSETAWTALLLQALNYRVDVDYAVNDAVKFASKLGISTTGGAFNKGSAIVMMYEALLTPTNGGGISILKSRISDGTISRASLAKTQLAGYANFGKSEYNADEIYERSSAANFYIEVFENEEMFNNSEASVGGSGFFVTPSGVALTAYHVFVYNPYMRIATTDGQTYSKIELLWGDPYRDLAVIKIGKTSDDGKTVNAFPYLPLGDSSLIANGERIFTLSNPEGHTDTITEGIISNKSRAVNDQNYKQIQFSAAVSHGSSGGALINRYGEAIGVILGAFNAGNDLNLGGPVNEIPPDVFTLSGESLKTVAERDNEIRDNSTIIADKLNVTIKEGEKTTIAITGDVPYQVFFYTLFENGDEVPDGYDGELVSVDWGVARSFTEIPLNIKGLKSGEAEITITYDGYSGNPDAEIVISVTVVAK